RPSLLDRAAKWSRRHQAIVAVAGAMLLLLTGVLIVAAVAIARERDAARESARREHEMARVARQRQAEAERDRRRAEADFRRARAAADRLFTRMGRWLGEVPGMERIQRSLLEDALEFYQGFLEDHGDDPGVRHEAALAAAQV